MATTAHQQGSRRDKLLGSRGEDAAVEFLRSRRYVVLHRNWRCREGELDIVATDGLRLVICEVKTRSGTGYGTPAEAISPTKAKRIRKLARLWLAEYPVRLGEIRFDVLAVLWPPGGEPTIEHIEAAF